MKKIISWLAHDNIDNIEMTAFGIKEMRDSIFLNAATLIASIFGIFFAFISSFSAFIQLQ